MNDFDSNAGYATWHARNWRAIPAGTRVWREPASRGGLEVIWKIENPDKGQDTDVSFVWEADGTPIRGSYRIVDWATDETLESGALRSEEALTLVLKSAGPVYTA